jgi:hypothetical protein
MKVMKVWTQTAKKIMSIHTSIWRAIDVKNLDKCAPFRICSLQSFAITTIVMDSQEKRNVWQSLQTNWSFSEHTFPLCTLLGKHVTSSLIGIWLYDFSARYKKNPEILSHENEANNSCKCKMHRREWMVTVSWILFTIENFLQFQVTWICSHCHTAQYVRSMIVAHRNVNLD